jgi:hypothetical protein
MKGFVRLLLASLLVAGLWQILDDESAYARPGGGQSYSGGGGSSSHSSGGSSRSSGSSSSSSRTSGSSSSRSGSGGGGSGEGMPAWIGIPLFVLMFVGVPGFLAFVYFTQIRPQFRDTTWMTPPPRPRERRVARAPAQAGLSAFAAADSEFSAVLFEDFAYGLFARAHEARSDDRKLAALCPYLLPAARRELRGRLPVRAVIVGSMSVVESSASAAGQRAWLEYEANLFVEGPGGTENQYVQERWLFERPAGVVPRPWKGARTFGCPNCGAPFEANAESRCSSCGEVVDDGRFDWQVSAIAAVTCEMRPLTLTGTVEEVGTDIPTVRQPDVEERWSRLCQEDPALTLDGLRARVALIHRELQAAWTAQDLAPVRPFLSAGLYAYMSAWVEAYRSQGLRNLVDDPKVNLQALAKVTRDKHYDAATIRVWESGRDYTVDAQGAVVGGSRDRERLYSEYWTLIRGAAVRAAPRADKSCPSCGAPLAVSMEGNCDHCGVLVTSGDFDWVLSKIEQDEAYKG